MKQRKKAFTLIELLVVIVIIGLLAALLFPVFSKIRVKANTVKCASNLRQIYLAMGAFATEHGGYVFVRTYTGPSGDMFQQDEVISQGGGVSGSDSFGIQFHASKSLKYLDPYLGVHTNKVFKCPGWKYDQASVFFTRKTDYSGLTKDHGSIWVKFTDCYVYANGKTYFQGQARCPLLMDTIHLYGSTAGMGNSQVHGNTGNLPLLLADGSVVTLKLPFSEWTKSYPDWTIQYLAAACGLSTTNAL